LADSSPKKRIAYITDLENRPSGGGSYAVNFRMFEELKKRFAMDYARPITPRPRTVEAVTSKVRRKIFGSPGRFYYFSDATLNDNAQRASKQYSGADSVFFRSATRWCLCRPSVPYFVYLDAVFHTFFHNTFDRDEFDRYDLERIWSAEAKFLEGAEGVFFESKWGMAKAIEAYGLKTDHYVAAGRGGAIDPPERDEWKPGPQRLLTVAMDFRQKGGDLMLAAFPRLKSLLPTLQWTVVGAEPTGEWRSIAGIEYAGMLRPDDHADRQRFREILSQASLLIHPTREDTSPLVITEAAYFGCPAVSVNRFGIPDLIIDGVTGLLLDPEPTVESIVYAVTKILGDEAQYGRMRNAARDNAMAQSTWPRVGQLISDYIARTIQ
jgi:glycosyltransferase involved in cell wall biosynthesis